MLARDIIHQSVQVTSHRYPIQSITTVLQAVVATSQGGILAAQQTTEAATQAAASAGDGSFFLNDPLDGFNAFIDDQELSH